MLMIVFALIRTIDNKAQALMHTRLVSIVSWDSGTLS